AQLGEAVEAPCGAASRQPVECDCAGAGGDVSFPLRGEDLVGVVLSQGVADPGGSSGDLRGGGSADRGGGLGDLAADGGGDPQRVHGGVQGHLEQAGGVS